MTRMFNNTPKQPLDAAELARAEASRPPSSGAPLNESCSAASRHAGTLDGRLRDLADGHVRDVCLHIGAATAHSCIGQHLLLHLLNLLMRMEGVIGAVSIHWIGDAAAADAALHRMVDPRRPEGGGSLREATRRLGAILDEGQLGGDSRGVGTHAAPWNAGGQREQRPDGAPLHVVVGDVGSHEALLAGGTIPIDALCVAAGAWTAYVGHAPRRCVADDEVARNHLGGVSYNGSDATRASGRIAVPAMGAYVAAAFVAGEMFLRCRDTRVRGPLSARYFSTWTWSAVDGLTAGDRDAWEGGAGSATLLPFLLAGVGAVGCAFLQSVWASSYASGTGILVDGDLVSRSNLNRYVLFGWNDVRQSKVLRASELLGACTPGGLHLTPLHAWWSDAQHMMGAHPVPLVISAVDTNAARHALQDALPGTILGGSTLGLRAEVGRYALHETSARCLRCFNTLERSENDVTLQRRLLQLSPAELAIEAHFRGVPADTLAGFVADVRAGGGGCAILDGATLQRLRHADGETVFAVSFVSSIAGTLLAMQLLREGSRAGPLLSGDRSRAIFQFWDAAAPSNAVHPSATDPSCVCQQVSYRQAHRRLWDRHDVAALEGEAAPGVPVLVPTVARALFAERQDRDR